MFQRILLMLCASVFLAGCADQTTAGSTQPARNTNGAHTPEAALGGNLRGSPSYSPGTRR